MIRRTTSRRWINSIEAHLGQIKRIDKHVDHTNGVALADEIIEAFGQQGRLPAIWPRNEALHPIPPTESRENHSGGRVFTQPRSEAERFELSISSLLCPRADMHGWSRVLGVHLIRARRQRRRTSALPTLGITA